MITIYGRFTRTVPVLYIVSCWFFYKPKFRIGKSPTKISICFRTVCFQYTTELFHLLSFYGILKKGICVYNPLKELIAIFNM